MLKYCYTFRHLSHLLNDSKNYYHANRTLLCMYIGFDNDETIPLKSPYGSYIINIGYHIIAACEAYSYSAGECSLVHM